MPAPASDHLQLIELNHIMSQFRTHQQYVSRLEHELERITAEISAQKTYGEHLQERLDTIHRQLKVTP